MFQVKRRFATFYMPKLVVVGLLWLAAVILSSWQEFNELHDPTYNYRVDTDSFKVGICHTDRGLTLTTLNC